MSDLVFLKNESDKTKERQSYKEVYTILIENYYKEQRDIPLEKWLGLKSNIKKQKKSGIA